MSEKILVVDDDKDSCAAICWFLRDQYHDVTECSDARQALELAKVSDYPMVLTDINMPGMSGLELLHAISALPDSWRTDVVLYTGYGDMKSAIQALRAGAYDYLLKPVDPEALADTLKRYSIMRANTDFRQKVDHLLHHLHHNDRIKVNTRAGFLLIDPAEILYATADGNYTLVHFSGSDSEVVTLNIGSLVDLLPTGHFSRISRSAMVNRSYLYRINRKKRICELRKEGVAIQLEVSREFLRGLG